MSSFCIQNIFNMLQNARKIIEMQAISNQMPNHLNNFSNLETNILTTQVLFCIFKMKYQAQQDCKSEEGNPTRQQGNSTTFDQEQVKLFSSQQLNASSSTGLSSPSVTLNTQRADKRLYKVLYALLIVGALLFVGAFLVQRLKRNEMEKALSHLEHRNIKQPFEHQSQQATIGLENSTLSVPQMISERSQNTSLVVNNQNIQSKYVSVQPNPTIKPTDPKFNLWDLTTAEKEELLRIYSLLLKTQQENNKTMNILTEADQQATPFFSNFVEHSNQLKWWNIDMNEAQLTSYQTYYKKILHFKTIEQNHFLSRYRRYKGSKQLVYENPLITITKGEIFDAVQTYRLTGQDKTDKIFKEVYQRQKLRLEKRHNISSYTNQLRACVIVPTYNNAKGNRLIWNIESILQQEYNNYRVIIVDDGSSDKTAEQIAKHLRWRNAPADKFIVIKSNTRNKSLYNIYYAVHRYCALGEIVYTIDGDDQLIGMQVFKLINAIYQKQKVYTLYTTYLNKSHHKLRLGYNRNYSFSTIQSNIFRKDDSHSYSHLRTMMSDLFLLANDTSFKDKDGKFYQMITDNAVYFCALQLSCKRVRFLQEINYLYNFETGINLANTVNKTLYKTIMKHVSDAKPYRCIDEYLLEAKKWYNASFGS